MSDATESGKKKSTGQKKKQDEPIPEINTEKKTTVQQAAPDEQPENDTPKAGVKAEPSANLKSDVNKLTPQVTESPDIPQKAPDNGLNATEPDDKQDKSEVSYSAMADINVLSGVPVNLTLSVGEKKMMIADVLKLKPGSIIQLDRREYEPLDISLNGTLFAKGEVVLLGEHYGLRILEIL